MNNIGQSVSKVFSGAMTAVKSFPVSIGCAVVFALVAVIRIALDWEQQQPFDFLFNCLQLSLALGAFFAQAATTTAQTRFGSKRAFAAANLLGAAAAVVTFLVLFFLSGKEPTWSAYPILTVLSVTRVIAAILISLIFFILFAQYPRERSDFTGALFMTLKAFVIAIIYGGVILAGVSGVAGAIQALIYRDMSDKVYLHIAVVAGFLTYSIFLGYFPDFRNGSDDERFKTAQKQPKFIEVLFGYIMVPIVLALTLVLLIWAGKTVFGGVDVSFERLFTISALYTVGGLWLHAMVARHESGLARVYRTVYPIASIVILLFEAWALISRLTDTGLKLTEYIFIIIWILAAAGCGLLLLKKSKAHSLIAVVAAALAFISVLPAVGYNVLPAKAQTARLEKLLTAEGILKNGNLTPALSEPERSKRASITDAVSFLANAEDAPLPDWFDDNLRETTVFKQKLGFDMTWEFDDDITEPGVFLGTYLTLPSGVTDISGYQWSVDVQESVKNNDGQAYTRVVGDKGEYLLYWTTDESGIPTLKITRDDSVILEQSLKGYFNELIEKYPLLEDGSREGTSEDMRLTIESQGIGIMLIFRSVSIQQYKGNTDYWVDIDALYLKEQ